MRFACLLVLVASTAYADPDPCVTPPKDPAPRKMAIDRAKVDPQVQLDDGFVEVAGTEFPAVSKDGKRVAQLFHDHEDLIAANVTTLVIYSTADAHVIASFTAGGSQPGSDAEPVARKNIKRANAILATTEWKPLPVYQQCTQKSNETSSTLVVDGVSYNYAPKGAKLTATINKKTTKVGAKFPDTGTRTGEVADGASCGNVLGLDTGFGAGKFVVLVPSSSFGGDSCTGAPAVDRSLAFVHP